MRSTSVLLSVAAIAAAAFLAPAHAQVTITPMAGGYIPASDVNQVTGSASNIAKTRDGTLGLGAELGFGPIQLGAMYASGTTIKNASKQDIGKGDVLAVSADLDIRPIPRIIIVQPYLLVGAGEKFYKYENNSTLLSGGDKNTFAVHGGLGADVMFGSVGVAAELTDFLSKGADNSWNVHDAFLMVGLRLRLGQ